MGQSQFDAISEEENTICIGTSEGVFDENKMRCDMGLTPGTALKCQPL
jgi:hypothetical protein